MRPAHETKNETRVECTVADRTYVLTQSSTSGETGSTVWLSSQVLATYLASRLKQPSTVGAERPTCLELGAGTGLVSLVVRDLGYAVTATDSGAVLPLLQHNVSTNPPTATATATTTTAAAAAGSCRVEEMDWCRVSGQSNETFPLLVCADVVYSPALLGPLLRTIERHARARTTLYLAQEVRTPALMDAFLEACRASFKVMRVPTAEIVKLETLLRRANAVEQKGDGDGDDEDEGADWSGVEIYKCKLKPDALKGRR
ncbi:protein of unknown function [Taphrina deformans PYCC 5710]|uniref:Uncharacterized protein n=1 Tax=Taphrina deformans (strain PYCC 5710 / ATCC 11124 / CBS 356.35 / IMI 108563 / JCM 9778 / NBRC 8474) TaxID=1097556 RepID=R4XGL7_TAPDE|nr:protein of unknown function [Taphrina deformans PYCC 5710]|eukprot:CCG84936.1 protein of unknown function [Taphrina deformans PYCC 5710]